MSKKPSKQKVEKLACLVLCTDEKVRQVLLNKDEMDYVIALIQQLHKGKVKVIDHIFDNVTL